MSEGKSDKELEVKFYVPDLIGLEGQLQRQGAQLVQPRTYEINLRFDSADGELGRSFRVLRLRQDSAARVTYKGPGVVVGGVRMRQELEFTVSDFDTAQKLFEALGYRVVVRYEKYRSTYAFEGVLVTLDEMPFGNFAEVEGAHSALIHATADHLNLDWTRRILDSYIALFDRLKAKMGLTFNDLSFDNFANLVVTAEDLGVAR